MPSFERNGFELIAVGVVFLGMVYFASLILHRTPFTSQSIKPILATAQTLIAMLIVLGWMAARDPAKKVPPIRRDPDAESSTPDGRIYLPQPKAAGRRPRDERPDSSSDPFRSAPFR